MKMKKLNDKRKSKKSVKKKSNIKDLSTVSVDSFMAGKLDQSDDDSDNNDVLPSKKTKFKKKKKSDSIGTNNHDNSYQDNVSTVEDNGSMKESGSEDNDSIVGLDSESHKKSLSKLRETDPDFYKFLEENDRDLLEFDASDSDEEEEAEESDKLHQPPQELEVGSDESDFEAASDEEGDTRIITLKMVKQWQDDLQTDRTATTIKNVMKAFHAALVRVSNDANKGSTTYKVDGSSVFNAVIQLCVLDLQPAIKKFLNISSVASGRVQHHKGKKWLKLKGSLKLYLGDLLRLLSGVTSTHILEVVLKHLHQLTPFVQSYPSLSRPLFKKLIQLWASGEETVRVLAFLCLLRITTSQQGEVLEKALKMMYMAYVSNCKFVSPNTLPAINFMRRSLTEMYALDEAASYQHVFLYVRQLAIHLRNAITLQKKETLQAVYNWQFVHSLHLWAELLGVTANKPHLQPLVYPLVQVIIGTIKLIPTAQYYPLRFHCVQILMQLSKNSNTFIPIMPFLLEILNTFDFNKRNKKVSMKPMNITCVLRLSKSQLQENGFKDVVIDKIYQQILECMTNVSYHISFPDLAIPAVIQLKKFLKDCKMSNYCKKIRQVLEKIEENSQVIENERRKVSFSLNDQKAIEAWESNMKLKGTPLITFYESWNKLHVQKVAKMVTNNEKLGEFNIPALKKFQKRPRSEMENPVELFPSDESDSDNLLSSEEPKTKRGKRGRKGTKPVQNQVKLEQDDDGGTDLVEDLRLSDLE